MQNRNTRTETKINNDQTIKFNQNFTSPSLPKALHYQQLKPYKFFDNFMNLSPYWVVGF